MTSAESNKLKGMSIEELWKLFPIVLTPYNPKWKDWAKDEAILLSLLLSEYSPIINHIGSTAIGGIMAKPIIDILVEIPPDRDRIVVKEILEQSGYICMSESEDRMSFNKGYTPSGYADKVFHIHIHTIGDNDEIIFRDYLIKNPNVAKEYEALKMSLLPKFKNNRDGYTDAKSEFIKGVMNKECTYQVKNLP